MPLVERLLGYRQQRAQIEWKPADTLLKHCAQEVRFKGQPANISRVQAVESVVATIIVFLEPARKDGQSIQKSGPSKFHPQRQP